MGTAFKGSNPGRFGCASGTAFRGAHQMCNVAFSSELSLWLGLSIIRMFLKHLVLRDIVGSLLPLLSLPKLIHQLPDIYPDVRAPRFQEMCISNHPQVEPRFQIQSALAGRNPGPRGGGLHRLDGKRRGTLSSSGKIVVLT